MHTHTHTDTHTQAITVVALRGAFNPNSFLGLLLPSEREQLSTAPSLLLAYFELHIGCYNTHITHTHTHCMVKHVLAQSLQLTAVHRIHSPFSGGV